MLKNIRLGQTPVALFAALVSMVALTGCFGIWSINRVAGEMQQLKVRASQQKLVMQMKIDLQESSVLLQKAVIAGNAETFAAARAGYQEKMDSVANGSDLILNGNPTLGLPPIKEASLAANIQSLQQALTTVKRLGNQVLNGSAADSKGFQQPALVDSEKGVESANLRLDNLLNQVGELTEQAYARGAKSRAAALIFSLALLLGGFLLALCGVLGKRRAAGSIDTMAKALSRGAGGDLTGRLEIGAAGELGQLGQSFNIMADKLSGMVGKVKNSLAYLGRLCEDIQGVSSQSVTAAESQADGISRASASLNLLNLSITEVAKGMDGLSLSAKESSSSTIELVSSLEQVVLNVDELAVSVDAVTASVIEMAASTKRIDSSIACLVGASATTASSVAEMSSSIKQVELSAIDNARISNQVLRDAEEGKAAVDATIAGMIEIKRASAITSEVVSSLSDRAGEIGKIVSVIDEVSEQTTLLALNAAIIAAQAGEHGRGFAVVAAEIKGLAERTSRSTSEIAAVIKAVNSETLHAVLAINEAQVSIIDGERLSKSSGKALGKIVSGVKKASEQMDKIAAATEEQGKGSENIRNAMDQVSEMIGQIAKAAGEQGTGSQSIMTAAQQMKDLTSQLSYAAREQSETGNLIGESTAGILDLIRRIKYVCDEQSRESSQILLSVQEIQQSAELNTESIKLMDRSGRRLTTQTEQLQRETGVFTVD